MGIKWLVLAEQASGFVVLRNAIWLTYLTIKFAYNYVGRHAKLKCPRNAEY